ncbi:hypothetical protein Tsubulata_034578 [Turnera subulata]|uniref:Uncharacterized protein n=1 Tax=Turnera subulata TaxID=218843 RepID=A0A9Q0J601_9ROSI|nr:hypothetical protein Tsubulata_034578 [Turnera subulata]
MDQLLTLITFQINNFKSVSYSGAPLFITAIVWFLLLGLSFCIACLCCCCCPSKKHGYNGYVYALTLILLIICTIAAIAGSVVLYTNHIKFTNSVVDALDSIIQRGMSIFRHLMSVWEAFSSAKNIQVNHVTLPTDLLGTIDYLDEMIKGAANMTYIQSMTNKQAIYAALFPVTFSINILAGVMLGFAFIGFLCAILGLRCLTNMLVTMGWILVTGVFILCGVFLIFRNVVADTCVAIDDFLQHPTANSALDLQFLPCVSNQTVQFALNTSVMTTKSLIAMDNQFIENIANHNDLTPDAGSFYYNQSGPLVPLLCDPYNDDLTDRKCGSDEMELATAAQEWKKHICEVSEEGICTSVGRLTPNIYNQLTIAVNMSISLQQQGPFLADLADCSFVLDTFKDISKNHCPGLRKYSYWTFVGLLVATSSVMCSVVFWIFYARERRYRKYRKKIHY